jgi:hypothetical protein
MKKFLVVVGVVLMLAGAAALIHPELKMPAQKREVEVQGQRLIINTRRIVMVPALLGGLVIVAGAGLVFVGIQKKKVAESAKPAG